MNRETIFREASSLHARPTRERPQPGEGGSAGRRGSKSTGVGRRGLAARTGEHGRAFPTGARNVGLLGDHHRINREGSPARASRS